MAIAEQADGGARQLMGALQDVTAWRRAEGEIQAHLVVDEVLENWDALDQGAELLLSRLAQSMDFDAGVLWIPQELELIPQGFWSSATLEASVLESTTKPLRLPAGDQVPARVWENLEPAVWIASPGEETHPRQQAAARAGLRSAIAFPAIGTDDVLAVIELFSRGEIEPARRLTRSLTGIGHELGRFLQGRRGALGPKLLTAREIQVLQLSANGSSGREIAAELVLSPATVKSHFENIYTKLSVSDRVSAVAIGLRQGFLD